MNDEEEGVLAEEADRREVGDDVVGWILLHVRRDSERAVGAEQQCVTVGRCTFHLGGGQCAIGAGLLHHDDRLAERLLQLLAGDARKCIGCRPSAKRNDEPDGLRWVRLCLSFGVSQRKHAGKRRYHDLQHGSLPCSFLVCSFFFLPEPRA
jgi:hypothetical protein